MSRSMLTEPDARSIKAALDAQGAEIARLRETHAIATDALDFIARARWAWRRHLVDAAAAALRRIAEVRARPAPGDRPKGAG